MMELILAGGGTEEQSKTVDQFFLKLFDTSNTILYIPIAISFGERHTPESVYNWITSTFDALDFHNIEMVTDLESIDYNRLQKYAAIYIGGGNTFKLLRDFKESGFYQLLKRYITEGVGPVYGGSAGAILFGKTIGTARVGEQKDPKIDGFDDYSSYNYAKGHDIDVHYFPKYDREVRDYSKNHGTPVISIPEESALYVFKNDGEISLQAIGDKPIFRFVEGRKTRVDKLI